MLKHDIFTLAWKLWHIILKLHLKSSPLLWLHCAFRSKKIKVKWFGISFVFIYRLEIHGEKYFTCSLHSLMKYFSIRHSNRNFSSLQGAKKLIFTACHSGKLKLAFTSPDVISTSPKSFLTSRIDFTVLLLFKFLKKHHLPVGQVKNRIH